MSSGEFPGHTAHDGWQVPSSLPASCVVPTPPLGLHPPGARAARSSTSGNPEPPDVGTPRSLLGNWAVLFGTELTNRETIRVLFRRASGHFSEKQSVCNIYRDKRTPLAGWGGAGLTPCGPGGSASHPQPYPPTGV